MMQPRPQNMMSPGGSGEFVVAADMLKFVLRIAWRRRWLILVPVLAALLAGAIYLKFAPPVYASTARLFVEQAGPKLITEQEGVMTQSKNYVYTQAELLKSSSILTGVITDPHADTLAFFAGCSNRLQAMKNALNINVGRNDDVISLSMEGEDPNEVAGLVNRVVDSYIAYHGQQKKNTSTEVLKILQNEKQKREDELAEKLQAILKFNKENMVFHLNSEGDNVITDRLTQLSNALTQSELEEIRLRSAHQQALAMLDDPSQARAFLETQRAASQFMVVGSPENNLKLDVDRLRSRRVELLKECTEAHPAIQALDVEMTALTTELERCEHNAVAAHVEQARRQWQECRERQGEIAVAVKAQEQAVQQLNIQNTQLVALQSEVKRLERVCDILDTRIKELNVTEEAGVYNITVMEPAKAEAKPVKPVRMVIMAGSLMVGIFLGIGLIFMMEVTDGRIRSAAEAIQLVRTSLLGMIPGMPVEESLAVRGQKVRLDSDSPVAEAYRAIRTALYFGAIPQAARTILITSPGVQDGKSTLVSNLALAIAHAGKKVLVLDANFRSPSQHEIFLVKRHEGLSNILAGQVEAQAVIQKTTLTHLDIIASGPTPPNPTEMLGSDAFRGLLAQLGSRYDHILVDAPATSSVADAAILSAVCDATLVVLRAEQTTRHGCRQLRERLNRVQANIIGMAINDVRRDVDRFQQGEWLVAPMVRQAPVAPLAPTVPAAPVAPVVPFVPHTPTPSPKMSLEEQARRIVRRAMKAPGGPLEDFDLSSAPCRDSQEEEASWLTAPECLSFSQTTAEIGKTAASGRTTETKSDVVADMSQLAGRLDDIDRQLGRLKKWLDHLDSSGT